MHYKRVVWILFLIFIILLAANKWYYTKRPNQLSFASEQLSLMKERNNELIFIDRHSKDGKAIIEKMYGRYSKAIMNNDQLLLSTPSASEFTLPQLEYDGDVYVLREHPALRFELWKNEPPDVILLGSSIFFCDFNREVFFEHYPDKHLLDLTTGNNTPFIGHYFLQYADSLGLRFKPGTIVLYGMNRVEMLEDYKDRHSHDFVRDALNGRTPKLTNGQQIAAYLKFPQLRHDVNSSIRRKYDDVFRSGNIYRKQVDKKYTKDETSFVQYIEFVSRQRKGKEQVFGEERINELRKIAGFLQEKGCRLVVLKLPQSLYNDRVMGTTGYSFFDNGMEQLVSDSISYVDAADFKQYDISQRDYLWPGDVFDPEHLNVQGAKRYTQALIENVLDTLLQDKRSLN